MIALFSGSVLIFLAGIACFVMIRQRIRHLTLQIRSGDKTAKALASELEAQALLVRQMSMDLEELRKGVAHRSELQQSAPPSWSGSGVPVNLNRRGQVIRLSRKGKSIAEIAQDLNVAQGEVELLLKVHDLSQQKAE
jgi:DNA-binding NarL/FixJ family response regulator